MAIYLGLYGDLGFRVSGFGFGIILYTKAAQNSRSNEQDNFLVVSVRSPPECLAQAKI